MYATTLIYALGIETSITKGHVEMSDQCISFRPNELSRTRNMVGFNGRDKDAMT